MTTRTVRIPAAYNDALSRPALLARLAGAGLPGFQVESISGDIATVVDGVPSSRPNATAWPLTRGTSPTAAPRVAQLMAEQGLALIEWNPYAGVAIAASLTPVHRDLVARLASLFRVSPWDLELSLVYGDTGKLARVEIVRAPSVSGDAAKRRATWTDAARSVFHSGWKAQIDGATGHVTLQAGSRMDIPDRVGFDWDFYDRTDTWSEISVGADGFGRPVVVDFSSTPHLGIFGTTGSGKSISIQTVLYGVLRRGWDVAIVEPTKRGNDFQWMAEHVRPGGWGCDSLSDALAVVRGIYAEGQRRAAILQSDRYATKWTDLSEAVRAENGIKPILLLIDEVTALAMIEKAPAVLPKDDPERIEMEQIAADKARLMMAVAKILAELRYVGIHCVLATQVWNVAQIGASAGPMRANLGTRLLFGRASTTQLAQAFTDQSTASAAYEAAHDATTTENDFEAIGSSHPGRGVAEIEGRGYVPMQGAYADLKTIESHLAELHLPKTTEAERKPSAPAASPVPDFWS